MRASGCSSLWTLLSTRSPRRLARPLGGARAAALALAATLLAPAAPAFAADLDGDGVTDTADNCVANVNPHQEDSDGDLVGDVCDPDTINAVLEPIAAASHDLHARTPFLRTKFSSAAGLQVGAEGGLGASANGGIGVPGSDDSGVVQLQATGVTGLSGFWVMGSPSLMQSSWQSAAEPGLFVDATGGASIRAQLASYANGVALGYELDPATIPSGTDAGIQHTLTLPSGWTLDTSELASGTGMGRVFVRDGTGTPRLQLSVVEVMAFGSETMVANSASFFGLTRLAEELEATAADASVGPPDLVGSNFYGGIEAPLVQTSYTLRENMADGAPGELSVVTLSPTSFQLTLVAPAAVVDRNRATSSGLFLGLRISSLTPAALPASVQGRHHVFFDEAADVTGTDVTLQLHNVLGTFDGAAPDYSLFPNNGGTAALYDALAQQQTVFGCAGCTMMLSGDSTIQFVGGGVGVGIAPGPRVQPPDPCIASDPINFSSASGRCAAGLNERAVFQADNLTITGSMSGLVAGEADVSLGHFVFQQAHDPNFTDLTLLHLVMGLGCAADAGVRIGVNPANGDITSDVPLDLSMCPADEVGAGTCVPPALAMPASSGICNLTAQRVELYGMGSVDNPLGTDLTMPSGDGIALHMRQGKGQIGSLAYDPETDACVAGTPADPSVVKGFETLASFSGGANVDPTTGVPLTASAADAVAPNVYCMDNVLGDELGVGLVVGGNVDLRASHIQVEHTLMGAIHVANGAANVETLASTTSAGTPCPSIDGTTCVTPAQELACPACKQGDVHFMALASAGKSAPTKLAVTDSVLGLDPMGGVSSGDNPALPALVLDANLTAMGGGLTIARRPASLFRTPIQVSLGADTMFSPGLLELTLTGDNIGVDAAAIAIDNMDSEGGALNFSLSGNCYSAGGGACITGGAQPVLAQAGADPNVPPLNNAALATAASLPNSDAGVYYVPEPGAAPGLAAGVALLAALGAARRRRGARPGAGSA